MTWIDRLIELVFRVWDRAERPPQAANASPMVAVENTPTNPRDVAIAVSSYEAAKRAAAGAHLGRVVSIVTQRNIHAPGGYQLTISWENGENWVVVGGGTVFHQVPYYVRLPTWLESRCADEVRRFEFERSQL